MNRQASQVAEDDHCLAGGTRLFHAQVLRDLPRNFTANLIHGMLGVTGFRLIMAPTFVPAYLYLLSGSKTVVGLAVSLQFLGMALSSAWGATLIEHRRQVLNVVYKVGMLLRLQVLGLALAGYLLAGQWALIATCVFLALFGFMSGMQNVSFNFLMSKVIPVDQRGHLTGLRNFLGGLTAAAVAYFGGMHLVEINALGNGYASTFLLAFVLMSVGIMALTLIREPESVAVRQRSTLWSRLRQTPAMLRSDVHYVRYLKARTLAALGATALPFYAIHAGSHVGFSGATLGKLSLAFLLAETMSNLGWGKLADKRGYRLVFLVSTGLWAVSTIGLLLATDLPGFLLAFCGLGAGFGGYMVTTQNFVLEFGTPHDRPMLIALPETAAYLMMAAGPLLGGLVAQNFSVIYVFWAAILAQILSMCIIYRIQEPRRQQDRAQGQTSK